MPKENVKASRQMLKVEFLKFSFSTFTIVGYQLKSLNFFFWTVNSSKVIESLVRVPTT
jgi:hypothetical protein